MPLTHNLWSGNSVEDQASTARAAERSAKIAQIKTGLGELAHILEGVVDVPENLRAIARATRQVVQAAQATISKFYDNFVGTHNSATRCRMLES